MVDEGLGPLLAEQAAYYQALAPAYLDGALDLPGARELGEALDAFRPTGDVLELACGPGTWTEQLLRHATTLTAVDAAEAMLALAAQRVGEGRVRFLRADLFEWRPDRRYDVVVFGFWLSHVPWERFAAFWALVDDCLAPDGRVFFADDAYRTPDELVHGAESSTIRRRLPDGTPYRAVKVPHTPHELEARLDALGWAITVHPTAGPFYWGAGSRASPSASDLQAAMKPPGDRSATATSPHGPRVGQQATAQRLVRSGLDAVRGRAAFVGEAAAACLVNRPMSR